MMPRLLCLLWLFSTVACAQTPVINNGDFESGEGAPPNPLPHWGFFSRTKEGQATRSSSAHQGAAAARVVHTGEKDWAFSNDTRIAVKEGQSFLATAFVKGKGKPQLCVVAYSKGERISWDIGSDGISNPADWTKLRAVTLIPPGIDQITLRLVGTGPTDVLIDDLTFASFELARPQKPLVQGHAATRVKEKLDRALIAIPAQDGKGVYISWRLLDSDPTDVAFNLYRVAGDAAAAKKLNDQPLTQTTDFVDPQPPAGEVCYYVRPIVGGQEKEPTTPLIRSDKPCLSLRLPPKETVQKIAIADLDGDGRLDYIVKTPNSNVDPYEQYWKKSPGTYKLHAISHDGKLLWTHDLGWSIEQGIWYSPYVVYDFDGDGRAEVALKAGDGDPRDPDGHVTTGDEHLLILDGQSGKEIARAPWPSREGFPSYNYYCRNQLGVAFLDGKTPCLIVERGTYNTIKVVAYQLRRATSPAKAPQSLQLNELWSWTDKEDLPGYRGMGAHCLRAADIDGDGRDEVIIGSAVLDDNGVGLWTTRLGHPDFMSIGDLDPARPGLEIAYGIETRQKKNGVCMVDAPTGKILWGLDLPTTHIHSQGLTSDFDPAHPGIEIYGGERDEKNKRYLFTAQGKLLSADKDLGGLAPRAAYWGAHPYRSLIKKGNQPQDHTGAKVGQPFEGSFVAAADILGDWREEIITTMPDGELRIYITSVPASMRHVTLLQDPIYRNDLAGASQGYYQMPSLLKLPSAK